MTTPARARYTGYRFPAEIISHAVWLYHTFSLSFRDIELMLAAVALLHEPDALAPLAKRARTILKKAAWETWWSGPTQWTARLVLDALGQGVRVGFIHRDRAQLGLWGGFVVVAASAGASPLRVSCTHCDSERELPRIPRDKSRGALAQVRTSHLID